MKRLFKTILLIPAWPLICLIGATQRHPDYYTPLQWSVMQLRRWRNR